MKVLFIGDIVGKPGRQAVAALVPKLRADYGGLDLVVANAENAAGGRGLTRRLAKEIGDSGVDFMTSGNHVWDQKQFVKEIESVENLLRPANLPDATPGRGKAIMQDANGVPVGLLNMAGAIFMAYDNPFVSVEAHIEELAVDAKTILVDFHAEATSEKIAMGRFLDGKVSLVVGTHTHVQTADETILPNGTAYITDVGMTGPHDGVIGMDGDGVVGRFVTQMPAKFDVAKGDVRLSAIFIEIDEETGRAQRIERLSVPMPD